VRITLLALVCMTSVAAAQSGAGQQAFDRGRELLKVGKYAEACAAFAESELVEPQTATELNIALCSEQLGKLGTALRLHRELAHRDDNPQRKISADMIAQLEPRAPRLKIDVSEGGQRARLPSGLVVRVNGMKATNFRETPGDLGLNRVIATAPGFHRATSEVTITTEGKSEVVTIILEPLEPGQPEEPDPDEQAELAARAKAKGGRHAASSSGSGRSKRKTTGMVITGLGGAALVGGFVVGALASSKWSDAKDVCGGGTTCATEDELVRANALASAARTRGTVSTALVVAGGALVAGGLVLWLTAPSHEHSLALAPGGGDSVAGLTVLGRF
jgi:hypothetical protein